MLSELLQFLNPPNYKDKLKSVPQSIVDLSPDAFVLINGKDGIPIWGDDDEMIDFNMDIESISITGDLESGVPSATIKFKTPEYGSKKYFISDGYESAISNYMEVEIYIKGRFLVKATTGDLKTNYYKAFHGYAWNFDNSLTLNCFGFLDIWRKVFVNYDPVSNDSFIFALQNDPFTLQGKNVFDIIYNEFTRKEQVETADDGDLLRWMLGYEKNITQMQGNLSNYKSYWQYYFNLIKSNASVFDSDMSNAALANLTSAISSGSSTQSTAKISQFLPDSFLNLYSEISGKTKFDGIKTVTDMIFFEFFQDFNGSVIVKPELYNLDIRNVKQQVINAQDLIDFNITQNFDMMWSKLYVTGNWYNGDKNGSAGGVIPTGIYTDLSCFKKYGLNIERRNHPFATNAKQCAQIAKTWLHRNNFINNKSGSMSIPVRPELRLGYPIYVSNKDMFVYPRSITHNIVFGETATTEITFDSVRTPFVSEKMTTTESRLESYKLPNSLDINHPAIQQFFSEEKFTEKIFTMSPSGLQALDGLNLDTFFIIEKQQANYFTTEPDMVSNLKRKFATGIKSNKVNKGNLANYAIIKGDLARKLRLRNILESMPTALLDQYKNSGFIGTIAELQKQKAFYEGQIPEATTAVANAQFNFGENSEEFQNASSNLTHLNDEIRLLNDQINFLNGRKKINKHAHIIYDEKGGYLRLKGDLNSKLSFLVNATDIKK